MATPTKFGTEFLVNTITNLFQAAPSVIALADGRFVVSWRDNSAAGGDTSATAIRAQVFNADGSPSGAEFLVNSTTAGSQFDPTITALADGRFVVSWLDGSATGSDPSGFAIRAQVFNPDGNPSGVEFLVNTTTAGNQLDPSITALAGGRFVVSWSDFSASSGDTSGSAIRAQVFNADGSASGVEFLVNTITLGDQSESSITALANGRFVVSWTDNSATGDDTSFSAIRAQVFNADGSASGAEFLVNTTIANNQSAPSVTALADGGFVVSWVDASASSGDTSGEAIRAQVFNADGSSSGGEFLVNTTTADTQSQPSVSAFADGRFVIIWTDSSASGSDTSSDAIRAQLFNADGSKSGDEFLVNTAISGAQFSPSVSTLEDGRFVVSWTDLSQTGNDTSGSAVRAQIFDPREVAVTLVGSKLGDDFIGTKFGDEMSGKKGDDTLLGQGGKDVLNGDNGNDLLKGGGGKDVLNGGKGNDVLKGGDGKDKLNGDDGKDTIKGDNGNDTLKGGKGNDKLIGGKGDDVLLGGSGKDKLTGSKGQDDLTGGKGSDTFIFKSTGDTGATAPTRDLIKDFKQGQGDVIDLSGIDAKAGGGNQAFSFIGTDSFSSSKGELRFKQNGGKTVVQGDVDGDGAKDFEIELSGLHTLTAGDFIL